MRTLYACAIAVGSLLPLPAVAIEIFYDFEGDSGSTATDKLSEDGAQDGTLLGNVEIQSDDVPFGDRASRFSPPTPVGPPEQFSTIEIPDSTELGDEWTLAAFVDYENTGFTRLFSSYQGTGAVEPNRVILDFDPSGAAINGIRLLVGSDGATSTVVPPELSEAGFKHVAVTFELGEIAVYLNGVPVAMDRDQFEATSAFAPVNLRFGEDPHDGGGAANEQFLGNVDDLIVVGQALSPAEIAAIADSGVEGNFTPGDGVFAVYYDFESPDAGTTITDRFDADGAQNGVVRNRVAIDPNRAHPLFGAQSARLELPTPPQLFSTIEFPETAELGSEWTLAAFVDYENEGFTRLFSSFQGTGPIEPNRVILDFDPSGSVINGLRVIVGPTASQAISVPPELGEPGFKHVALTFDSGSIAVYLNGVEVDMDLDEFPETEAFAPVNLRFGEDPHDGGGTANEQFRGHVDDLLVIGRALSPADIAAVADSGVDGNVTPQDGEFAIFYDFEPPDSGTTLTDRFQADGAQNGIAHNNVRIDPDVAHPLFGSQSAKLGPKGDVQEENPFSVISVGPVGNLGPEVTFAAVVNVPGGGFSAGGLTRLFSTFSGTGNPAGRLVFDFDPNASVEGIGIRFLVPDGTALIYDGTFSVDEDHHIAAVYSSGSIEIFLDGVQVAARESFGGDFDLGEFPLRIGEDLDGVVNENFIGVLDEVLILEEALSADEIARIASEGFGGGDPPEGQFRRGDPNDSGADDIADAIFLLNNLFGDGPPPTCAEAADANDDGQVNIADPIFQLNFLFGDGPPTNLPGSELCGPDPEPGTSVGCEAYTSC